MKRPEKEAVIAELTDKFRNADAIYLTEYRGLTVPQISELREKLGRGTRSGKSRQRYGICP